MIARVMDEVFKALADASRRRLLDDLHQRGGQTLGELCQHLAMTRQAVTKHLALLEAANLVATVWRGREKLHYLNPVPLHEIYERWIAKYKRHRLEALSDLKDGLEQNNNTEKNIMSKPELVFKTYIRSTAERTWEALTTPEFTRQYWGGNANISDWTKGAKWEHVSKDNETWVVGEVEESNPPKLLVVSWADPDDLSDVSRVTYEIEPLDGVVCLTVTHDNFKADSTMPGKVAGGWPRVLSSLKSFLETGAGLKVVCGG